MPPSVKSSVKPELRWRKRDEQDLEHSESFIASYDCAGAFPENDAREAIVILEMLNAPAAPDACAKELGRLKVLTKERAVGQQDMVFQIAVMAEELSAYPLDVVRNACRVWSASNTFYPSWAELRELCEERVLRRRCLLDALRRYFKSKEAERNEASTEPDRPQGTDSAAAPTYNALWKARQNELEQAVGTESYRAWLRELIPVVPKGVDTAGAYQLGAPTRFIRNHVEERYSKVLAQILGREVRLIVWRPPNPAHRARRTS